MQDFEDSAVRLVSPIRSMSYTQTTNKPASSFQPVKPAPTPNNELADSSPGNTGLLHHGEERCALKDLSGSTAAAVNSTSISAGGANDNSDEIIAGPLPVDVLKLDLQDLIVQQWGLFDARHNVEKFLGGMRAMFERKQLYDATTAQSALASAHIMPPIDPAGSIAVLAQSYCIPK